MKTNKDNKSITWQMRVTSEEKKKIATLAKLLNCKSSEAVRRAIVYSLATLPNKSPK